MYAIGKFHTDTFSNIVDLNNNSISSIAPQNQKRSFPACIPLNGNIYVIGGFNIFVQPGAELFDVENRKWRILSGTLFRPRSCASVAVINGSIYLAGGYVSSAMVDAEVLDIEEESWTDIAPMKVKRRNAGMVSINESLYIFGGTQSKIVERYDSKRNEWITLDTLMPVESGLLKCSAVVIGDSIHIIGTTEQERGYNLIFYPINNTWIEKTPLPLGCIPQSAVAL